MKLHSLSIIVLMLVCLGTIAFAQRNANPFELTPRLPEKEIAESDSVEVVGNPFDITTSVAKEKVTPFSSEKKANRSNVDARMVFLFTMVMFILLAITILFTISRSFFIKSYRAFLNENMTNQLLREVESTSLLPFIILYSFFFINIGFFTYLVLESYNILPKRDYFLYFAYCLGVVIAVLLLKHLLLSLVGYIFPVYQEIQRYNFTIIIFGIVIGLILTPVNVLLAYGPDSIDKYLIFLTLGTLGIIYLYRYIRGILIANRFWAFHRFHFLLYICTVEIAPVMVLVKLATSRF